MEIKLKQGLMIEVDFNYSPEESETSNSPAYPWDVEINSIELVEGSLFDLFNHFNQAENLEYKIYGLIQEEAAAI